MKILLISLFSACLIYTSQSAAAKKEHNWIGGSHCDAQCIIDAKREYERQLIREMLEHEYFRNLFRNRETTTLHTEPEINNIVPNPSNNFDLCIQETELRFNSCTAQAKVMDRLLRTVGSYPTYKLAQILTPETIIVGKKFDLKKVGFGWVGAAQLGIEIGTIVNEKKCADFKVNQTVKCNTLKG